MKSSIYPLWHSRKSLPKPSPVQTALMAVLTVAFSVITSVDLGGMLFIGLAGAIFGLLLCTVRGLFPYVTVPTVAIISYVLSESPLLTACSLLFVPVGLAIAYCIFTERRLSVTFAIVSVTVCLAVGADLAVAVLRMYGGDYLSRFRTFGADFMALLRSTFESLQLPAADGQLYSLPEETVELLIETALMVMPAMAIILCQLLAYISIRAARFGARCIGMENILYGYRYSFTIAAPTAILYLASGAVGLFLTGNPVIFYSAVNLTYILTPAVCLAGFNMIFGRNGVLRRRFPGVNSRTVLIICIVLMLISPAILIQVLSLYSTLSVAFGALGAAIRRKMTGSGDDSDK